MADHVAIQDLDFGDISTTSAVNQWGTGFKLRLNSFSFIVHGKSISTGPIAAQWPVDSRMSTRSDIPLQV